MRFLFYISYTIIILFYSTSFYLSAINSSYDNNLNNNKESNNNEDSLNINFNRFKTINNIIIEGNVQVPQYTILSKIPYVIGGEFNPSNTRILIKNLYDLGFFNSIEIEVEELGNNKIDLYIILNEKKRLEKLSFHGNKHLTKEEIENKLKISEILTADLEELEALAEKIKKLYCEKNYHGVQIKTILNITKNGNIEADFFIDEGKASLVKRVNFIGNKSFNSKKLKDMIFTREDWIGGFLDKAGTFQPDAIEYDKYVIENFYQSNGFLTARVTDVNIDIDPETQYVTVTFVIEEGDIFTIGKVTANINDSLMQTNSSNMSQITINNGNDTISIENILKALPIKSGQLYSKEAIRQAIELLRLTWGQFGYIYADIEPQIQPNLDEKIVDINFNFDLGSKVFLNRINIIGNKKTKDKVIRRYIDMDEGDLLTSQSMDISKSRIESLGFFEPNTGVGWKINKIDENLADLDLIVNEIRTGKISGQIGYGGADSQSPSSSVKISAAISDRNFMGKGIRYNFNYTYSPGDRGLIFNVYQPWLFDRPLGIGLDAYKRKSAYEDFANLLNTPVEDILGGACQMSYSPVKIPDLGIFGNFGAERISYEKPIIALRNSANPEVNQLFQILADRRFQPGILSWIAFNLGQDRRNHPVFPSRGYNWNLATRFAIPNSNGNFSFAKVDFGFSWLTPLIGEASLIYLLHTHFGYIHQINNGNIPYRELYHVGGPSTVRGFLYGQIGPQVYSDSLGAKKAFWINMELIFSVTQDQSVRGVFFYDGGAGWDTPNAQTFNLLPIQNNTFNYRHAIGFGIRITKPTPFRIDWGFKLDRNKRRGEKVGEVHFSMTQDF